MIGLVLAGGRASRLGGGDKGLLEVETRAILDLVLAVMQPQCTHLLISANGDPARFARFGAAVVADSIPDCPGPLAGLLAGLDHVAVHHPGAGHVVTVPCDTPFLPHDLVARLDDQRLADRAAIVQARSGGRVHNVIGLWSVGLRHDLRHALVVENFRRVRAFAERHPLASVTWPTEPVDHFFNVNTPEDLAAARSLASKGA